MVRGGRIMRSVRSLSRRVAHANIESASDRPLPTFASLSSAPRSFVSECTRNTDSRSIPGEAHDDWIGGRVQAVRGRRALSLPAAHRAYLLLLAAAAARDRSQSDAVAPQHRAWLRQGVRPRHPLDVSLRRRLRA